MKSSLKLFAIFILISGCTTVEFVRKDLTPHKQGILRHSIASNSKQAAEYRKKINQAATDFCQSEFLITKEYQAREHTGTTTGIGTGFGLGMGGIMVGGSNQGTAMYNFVEFSCE